MAILKGFANEPYHQILGPTKKRGGPAGIILKNGYQIASWGDTRRVDMTFSVTKSYLSTVAGLAVDRGLIKTDDVTVNSIWDTTFDGAHNEQITWKHLPRIRFQLLTDCVLLIISGMRRGGAVMDGLLLR